MALKFSTLQIEYAEPIAQPVGLFVSVRVPDRLAESAQPKQVTMCEAWVLPLRWKMTSPQPRSKQLLTQEGGCPLAMAPSYICYHDYRLYNYRPQNGHP
jgi:hypothetical protein